MSDTNDNREAPEAFDWRMFNHENTPPPILIEDGSLRISTPEDKELVNAPGQLEYTGDVTGTGINHIAHIKVLHGSGDILYRTGDAPDDCRIKVELHNHGNQSAGHLKFRGGAMFAVNSDSQLNHSGGHPNGKHKLDHTGGGAAKFRVRTIKVTLGDPDLPASRILFQVDAGNAPANPAQFKSEEYRVLVWLHGE